MKENDWGTDGTYNTYCPYCDDITLHDDYGCMDCIGNGEKK